MGRKILRSGASSSPCRAVGRSPPGTTSPGTPPPKRCGSDELERRLRAERARDARGVVRELGLLRLRQRTERLDLQLHSASTLRALPYAGDAAVDEQHRVG